MHWRTCINLLFKITMSGVQACTVSTNITQRLFNIQGLNGKTNNMIYHPAIDNKPLSIVVYFGGDMQDFLENMASHRDNKGYVKWNLENTASLLHEKFPSAMIFVVKPSRMHLKTFSCYENFVDCNDFGAPNHQVSSDALQHLKLLLHNAQETINQLPFSNDIMENECAELSSENIPNEIGSVWSSLPVTLVGFSKGCVVLNQLLYSFKALCKETSSADLLEFVEHIKVMYWLDGGHAGSHNAWITDKSILQNYCQFGIKTRVHVTPYQVLCPVRPRVGKEEKIFRETLRKLSNDIERTLHFADEPASSENHFRVLEVFVPSE